MKRSSSSGEDPATGIDQKLKKKIKPEEEDEAVSAEKVLLDENLLYEVLKHADACTLATAACVSRQWHKTAQDERLWELICTKHIGSSSSGGGFGGQQLRSVVLALGGFRRLHSRYLLPLSKPSSSSLSGLSSTAWPCLPPPPPPVVPAKPTNKSRWGKDEVNLSLCLLSIGYYEKMNFNNRGK